MCPQDPVHSVTDQAWAWAEESGAWVPPAVDLSRPSAARMYDYYLGGKDNFAVDREAADTVITVVPDARRLALANRAFLTRAVQAMTETGIEQFIDLGSGLPTSPTVHEIARASHPYARVAYVDNDPVVAVHSRALINPDRHTRTVTADLRQPDTVLAAKGLADLIDLTRPVGLLLIAVAHFLDPAHAAHIVDRYMRALPAGSMLAISAAQRDGADPATLATLEQTYADSPTPVYLRTRAQVIELFADLPLIDPGLTDITQWRAHGYRGSLPVGCGVAVKNG